MTGIIDYGSGNVHAIANLHRRKGIAHVVTRDAAELRAADRLILPGVGAFDETMRSLHKLGLKDLLDGLVLIEKRPILGVCVGMQILGESSEEGDLPGFGWIKGQVKKFDPSKLTTKPHLPHLGWNSVEPNSDSPLFTGVDGTEGFYFLHSYFFDPADPADVLATTNYGGPFTSAIGRDNVFGFQFHPEKSHANGEAVFQNFSNLPLC